MIRSKFKNGPSTLPKAVVMTLGTGEDGYYVNPSNASDIDWWSDYISDVTNAWRESGLGQQKDVNISNTNLAFFTVIGGIHSGQSLNNFLVEGVRLLYQSNISTANRKQLDDHYNYYFPTISSSSVPVPVDDCTTSDNENSDVYIALISLFASLLAVSAIIIFYLYRKLLQVEASILSSSSDAKSSSKL
jgi:hypothetical protein